MSEARNEKGQTLSEFLSDYDPNRYERPSVTVDMAVVTDEGEVLLIRRRDHPNIGRWALPGGFVNMDESLYAAAARELSEETGLFNIPLVPLGMFGEPTRDPRTRIITAAFLARSPRGALRFAAGDDADDAALFSIAVEKTGRVAIPSPAQKKNALTLPCTACGQPYGREGTGYVLTLKSGPFRLRSHLAADDSGVAALLGGASGWDSLAGDHALVLFYALRACGLTD